MRYFTDTRRPAKGVDVLYRLAEAGTEQVITSRTKEWRESSDLQAYLYNGELGIKEIEPGAARSLYVKITGDADG